jgi:TatA/E family protein of Tat protein translocase
LVVFGAAKLPTMAHSLGKSLTSFKKGIKDTAEDVKDAIKEDAAADTDPLATSDAENTSVLSGTEPAAAKEDSSESR